MSDKKYYYFKGLEFQEAFLIISCSMMMVFGLGSIINVR